jgi:hypothetical protein
MVCSTPLAWRKWLCVSPLQKRSPVKGWFIRPRSGTPSLIRPIRVPQSGWPTMKARVPSIGSMIQQ